jgi:hypothetical protein
MQTEPSKADPPKRNRRWFQFSLRTLLIGVTLLAATTTAMCVRAGKRWQYNAVEVVEIRCQQPRLAMGHTPLPPFRKLRSLPN